METLITVSAGIASGFSILVGLILLVKLWHEPRLIVGILPGNESEAFSLSPVSKETTVQRTKYSQKMLSMPREFKRNSEDSLILPVLVQNQGHGMANTLNVNIEFDTDQIEILDIWTEVMTVNAVFGNACDISSKLASVVANIHIKEAYSRLGPSGTYIQLIGSFPAGATEIFVLKIRIKNPLRATAKIRAQTPQRIFQQKDVRQDIVFA